VFPLVLLRGGGFMAVIIDESVLSSLSEATEMLAYQLMMKEEEESSLTGEQQRQVRKELDGLLDNENESRRLDNFSEEELW